MDTVDGTNAAVAAQATSVEAGTLLGFLELRQANLLRAREWSPTGKDIVVPFARCELAEQVDQAIHAMSAALHVAMGTWALCDANKEAEQAKAGIAGGVADRTELLLGLADLVILTDFLAMRLGVDLGAAIVKKFNLTSRERGFGTKLDGFGTLREEALRGSARIYRAQRDAMLELWRTRIEWHLASDRLWGTLQRRLNEEGQKIASLLSREGEAADQPWKRQDEEINERLCSLGIDTERWCVREEEPAQPAAAGSPKVDGVHGGED